MFDPREQIDLSQISFDRGAKGLTGLSVPRHRKKKDIKGDFKITLDVLLKDIADFRQELMAQEQAIKAETIGLISEAEECGGHYEDNIIPYLDELDDLKEKASGAFQTLSRRIAATLEEARAIKPDGKVRKIRRRLLLEFVSATDPLGGRPSKKFSSALFDGDQLVELDTNHLCPGLPRDPRLLTKDTTGQHNRGVHLWCAERNVIASYLGVQADVPVSDDLVIVHKGLERFTLSLTGAALHNRELHKLTLVSSHFPCEPCANVIVPAHKNGRKPVVRELITWWNEASESGFTSDRATRKAKKMFRQAGMQPHVLVCGCGH